MLKKIIPFIVSVFLLSSCVTTDKVNYLQEKSSPFFKEAVTPEDYKVQTFDELYIQVIALDETSNNLFNLGNSVNGVKASNTYTIFEDGCIDFPFVGRIYVVDKPCRDIARIVKKALAGYIKGDYSVQVRLGNSTFSMIGPGGATGVFPITREKLNIYQALALTGDLNDYADRARVKILRQTPQGTQLRTFNVKNKDIMKTEFFYVQPNDVIYVEFFKGQYWQLHNFGSVVGLVTTTSSIIYAVLRLSNAIK